MMIKHVWVEQNEGKAFNPRRDSADVLVETDDELLWTASFVTIPYLQRQMELSRDVLLDLLRRMLRIRLFEEEAGKLMEAGKIPGALHLYVGEEAVAAGVMTHLSNEFPFGLCSQ